LPCRASDIGELAINTLFPKGLQRPQLEPQLWVAASCFFRFGFPTADLGELPGMMENAISVRCGLGRTCVPIRMGFRDMQLETLFQ
jgi:hypothetical protein